jgi:hypothetical protein
MAALDAEAFLESLTTPAPTGAATSAVAVPVA